MSDVRVSSASPSLERMEGRPSETAPKSQACRVLFGICDREALRRELEEKGLELEVAFRERWNYDPRAERPLEGRMDWRAVPKDEVPDFYYRPVPRKRCVEAPGDGNANSAVALQDNSGDLLGAGEKHTETAGHRAPKRTSQNGEGDCPAPKASKIETDAPSVEQKTPSKSNNHRRSQT